MPRAWLCILSVFVVALLTWAIFGAEETQHRIAIVAVAGAILTAITSVLTIVINNNEAKERETRLMIRKEQQKVFTHFYSAFFEMLKSTKKGGGSQPPKRGIEEMLEFKRGLMNWGSEKLIASYLEYEASLESAATAGTTTMLESGDRFIKSMRRELGFEDSGTVNILAIILTPDARRELLDD